ncbi:acyl-CoA synthetase [Coccidioides immitis H538.4]|uniref:Acyl-CoA synthetase n=2 Tax=Coccidioides immitis TaxID=5501 RepID=A0A0J8S0V2_COCIT|nr:AMP-binding protein [Coccidioides immitis RMSCC 2394]KMU90742.1 acyl-CoA synthetase [Coccidioides immitis H538.4]
MFSFLISTLASYFRRKWPPSPDIPSVSGCGAMFSTQGFPNDPMFTRLRRRCIENAGVIIHDESGIDAGYDHLVGDVMHMRKILQNRLPSSSFDEKGCLRQEAASIALVVSAGYYFIVSFLAIAALGGVCVPLGKTVTPEEALYFLKKSKAACVLADADTLETAEAIGAYARNQNGQKVHIIPITRAGLRPNLRLELEIDEELCFPSNAGSLILFTSGTTALPKGILLPRQLFYEIEDIPPITGLYLSSSQPQWIGGATGLIFSAINGERIHIVNGGPEPRRYWEILRKGKVTEMGACPTLLRTLMEYYNEHIRDLPTEDRDAYISGAQSLRVVYSSGSALNPATRQFFVDLMNMPIRNAYGISEMGGGLMVTSAESALLDGCIGTPIPGVTVKLSEGDHGEILVKKPSMFIRYVDDPAATHAAFDDEGFYKTGDHAHRVGDNYFFDGRVSYDWVRFHEYRISVLEIEQILTDLGYISEAHVIPVPDHEAGGLVSALVRIRKRNAVTEEHGDITLQKIRQDLAAANIAAYKLPALLRVLRDHEQVPLTASGKVLKKQCLQKFFDISGYLPDQYAVDGVEYWGNKLDLTASTRVDDWGEL